MVQQQQQQQQQQQHRQQQQQQQQSLKNVDDRRTQRHDHTPFRGSGARTTHRLTFSPIPRLPALLRQDTTYPWRRADGGYTKEMLAYDGDSRNCTCNAACMKRSETTSGTQINLTHQQKQRGDMDCSSLKVCRAWLV